MSARWLRVNVNDQVQVRLTGYGRQVLRDQHDRFVRVVNVPVPWEFRPKAEDADGWSTWQLWELMNAVGEHMYLAAPLPFETVIRVDRRDA